MNTIGADGYGVYVFSLSIVTYAMTIVNFGFDMPGVRAIAENSNDRQFQSRVVSAIITSKLYLVFAVTLIFAIVVFCVPMLRESWLIFAICYIQVFSCILLQNWFFQGIQKMKIVTIAQFAAKLLSLVFIFGLVKTAEDIWLFALISSCASLFGSVCAYAMMYREGIKVRWANLKEVKLFMGEGLPFFLSGVAANVKWQINPIILGTFFTMSDVTTYDLAYKILAIPIMCLTSITSALFPKTMQNYRVSYVKKLITIIAIIAIIAILATIFLGKYAVQILGGCQMTEAYYFLMIMSLIIFSWIVVSAYSNLLFVPNKIYYAVTNNQVVALVTYLVVCSSLLIVCKSIYIIAGAMVVSSIAELIYCNIIIRRKKLLIA
jgi:PST family polysaccharide transporter